MRAGAFTYFRAISNRSGPRSWLPRLAARVAGATGWRRALLALTLGALAVLALPPVYIVPALIPAFTGLLWLLQGARHWRAALLIGFLFGLGYFTAGLYWVANALLTRPEEFGWLAPFAPVGLAAILAPFPAIACALTTLAPRPGVSRVLAFAAAWILLEWVRSWAFTGFPWNLVGSVWAFSDAMLQPAAWIGVYGLGLATVAAAAMPSVLSQPASGGRRGWLAMAITCAVLGAFFLAGLGSPCLDRRDRRRRWGTASACAGEHIAEPEVAARVGRQAPSHAGGDGGGPARSSADARHLAGGLGAAVSLRMTRNGSGSSVNSRRPAG